MKGNVLSILSHVVHGYVGNRAVTFPLQLCGWNVDAINTVNLSNHPGYGKFGGKAESVDTIKLILEGLNLIENGVSSYDMIITGYFSTVETAEIVKQTIMNQINDKKFPLFVMDPVLGDNGKMYLPEQIIPIYQELLRSGCVDLITPNQFEFEILTQIKINSLDDLKAGIKAFNAMYQVPNVVISSIVFGGSMYSVAYNKQHPNTIILVTVEEIPCKFFGSGDLFTGIIANNFYEAKSLTSDVLQDSLIKLTNILNRTYDIERQHDKNVNYIKDIKLIELRHFLMEKNGFGLKTDYIDLE